MLNFIAISILVINFVWHSLAVELFIFRPKYMMENYLKADFQSKVSIDIIRFVGGLNTGYVVLALVGIFVSELRHPGVFMAFAFATLSQFVFDIKAHKEGKVTSLFNKITYGDGIIGFLNLIFSIVLFFKLLFA